MSTTSSFVRRLLSAAIVVLAVALVLVPPAARARQHVDRQDATRLSIKHSWLGIAPPTKASVAPAQAAAILPPPVVEVDHSRLVSRIAPVRNPARPSVDDQRFDPLRGPPSRLS